MTDLPRCGRFRAWWHRRLRRADRLFTVPLLVGAARARGLDERAIVEDFLDARGQEHWCCPCATTERQALMEVLL